MPDFSAAYRGARERFTNLTRAATEDQLALTVPACPAWTVKDLFAHVTGVAEDMVAGRIEGVAQPHWTAAQIERAAGLSVGELAERWATAAAQVEAALNDLPASVGGLTVADLVTHEHDLRGALGAPGARGSDEVALALDAYGRLKRSRAKESPVALRLIAGEREWVAGQGEPQVSVAAEPFEMFRSLAGRRTAEEIRALDWSGNPEPFIEDFAVFEPPARSLGE